MASSSSSGGIDPADLQRVPAGPADVRHDRCVSRVAGEPLVGGLARQAALKPDARARRTRGTRRSCCRPWRRRRPPTARPARRRAWPGSRRAVRPRSLPLGRRRRARCRALRRAGVDHWWRRYLTIVLAAVAESMRLADQVQRPRPDLVVDPRNVLADHPDHGQLHPAEERNSAPAATRSRARKASPLASARWPPGRTATDADGHDQAHRQGEPQRRGGESDETVGREPHHLAQRVLASCPPRVRP